MSDTERQAIASIKATRTALETLGAELRERHAKLCEALMDEAKEAELLKESRELAGKPGELEALRFWLAVSTYNAGIRKCAAAIRDEKDPQ